MKYYVLSLSFVFISYSFSNITPKDEITSKEIYYMINDDGTINKDSITEIRKIIYNQKWEFISGTSSINNKKCTLTSDASKYYVLPTVQKNAIYCEYDSMGRILIYKKYLESFGIEQHSLRYDNWSNLSEDLCTSEGNNQLISRTTYEYLYLNDFTYTERRGKRFISGMKENNSKHWLNRTIKYNGKIIEYTERKIQNGR